MPQRIFARFMTQEGRFHYGLCSAHSRDAGPLFEISFDGDTATLETRIGYATPLEHQNWIDSMQQRGYLVKINEVIEPRSARM